MQVHTLGSENIAELPADGALLSTEQDAIDVIGSTFGLEVDRVVVPKARLGPDFWVLRTGLAGAFIQKFVNYGLQLAFVGDISGEVARSEALRDFVRELNRGRTVWFVRDVEELGTRLDALD